MTGPVTIVEDLNQFIRFKKPGSYNVQVKSARVSLTNHTSGNEGGVAVVLSNWLSIVIQAAPDDWVEDSIVQLDKVLANSPSNKLGAEAAWHLAYLNTEDSTRALLRWYGSGGNSSYHSILYQALLNSPFPAIVINGLEELLQDPLKIVPRDTVLLMALKAADTEYKDKPLTKLVGRPETFADEAAKRNATVSGLKTVYCDMLRGSLTKRSGVSLTEALAELASENPPMY